MSVFELIFIKVDSSPLWVAQQLADNLDMNIVQNEQGVFVRASNFAGTFGEVGGEIYRNIYSDPDNPEERTAYNGYSIVWDIWRPGSDEERQIEAARAIFLEISRSNLMWSAVFIHDHDWILASYDPYRGLREFPPKTSPDAEHEHIWR